MIHLDTKNITILSVVILLALMLYSGMTFKFDNTKEIYLEEPLEKNSNLQILPGDEYRYGYMMNNSSVNITYVAMSGKNCTYIFIDESVNNTNICVDEWGMDGSGFNTAFENPSFILFKPWMLALHPTWKWNSSLYIDYGDVTQHISNHYYRVMRVEEFKGRQAFVVEIKTERDNIESKEYQWIDAERRVLLKIMGDGYLVELVSPDN